MSEGAGQSGGMTGQKTTSGMAPNVGGALSYVLGIITGILFYVLEKEDGFIRFHAMQSILFNVAWTVLWIVLTIVMTILGFVPFLGIVVAILGFVVWLVVFLGGFVLWLFLIIKAYQGEKFKLPYIGDMAENYAGGGK
ncbi:MAG: DUF4870 domain-containing protein [Chloroflexi bacterium]|nr:DUF4870 domain-containing protein [Chloroflexota bacterium]MDA8186787.1 DUF4870 domain-containing protein [Dehalococcoidales bacterium]